MIAYDVLYFTFSDLPMPILKVINNLNLLNNFDCKVVEAKRGVFINV